jgi:hypothetical protein
MFEVVLLIVCGTSIWVFYDAHNLGVRKGLTHGFLDMGPTGWAFACLLFWIIAFPIYLGNRSEYARLAEQGTTSEQIEALEAQRDELLAAVNLPLPPQDLDQQLRSLAKLRDDGLITEADFEAKKKKILGI